MRDLQLRLRAPGYDPGDIDGVFGPHTEAALEQLQGHDEPLAGMPAAHPCHVNPRTER